MTRSDQASTHVKYPNEATSKIDVQRKDTEEEL